MNPGGATQRGIDNYNAGRHEQAVRCFREAVASGDRDPLPRCFMAYALDSLGRTKEAVRSLSALIKERPRYGPASSALVAIVLRALRQGTLLRPEELARMALMAEKALRKALKSKDGDPQVRRDLAEVLLARGRAAYSAGRFAPAEKSLSEARMLAPEDARARSALAETLRARGWALLSEGRLKTAETVLRRERVVDEDHADFRRHLVGTLLARLRDGRAAGRKADDFEMLRLREQLYRVGGRLRAREKILNRILRTNPGPSIVRFKALMNLRRYEEAFEVAERILDGKPVIADSWGFANPWDWEDWMARDIRTRQIVRDLERRVTSRARRPWLHYYRGALSGPAGLPDFDRLADFSRERYGWMYLMAGRICLVEADLSRATTFLKIASRQEPVDWRSSSFLAEAYLARQQRESAFAEMERAACRVPPENEGLLLAWRGAFDLWTGDYESALRRLDRACDMDAPHAFCWRAAALLKLGKPARALEKLDLTLSRFPGDLEAYIWRAEAKRELGRHEDALLDLGQSEPRVWVLVNRALARGALHDHAGMKTDFEAIPKKVTEYISRKLGLEPREVREPEQMRRILEAGLKLSNGWRREEYGQSIWMI